MDKLYKYILKLRAKPEQVRREILAGVLTICMAIVGGVWVYGLSSHFGSGEIVTQTKEDVKPFALFGEKIKSTYKDMVASVGKANSPLPIVSPLEEVKPEPDNNKVIDLIPVEQ
jgi:hypothetical protein